MRCLSERDRVVASHSEPDRTCASTPVALCVFAKVVGFTVDGEAFLLGQPGRAWFPMSSHTGNGKPEPLVGNQLGTDANDALVACPTALRA